MKLDEFEAVVLVRARKAIRSWRVVRLVLIPIAIASVALGLFLSGSSEFVGVQLTKYLAVLLILIGVGITSLLFSGWSDIERKMLIELLEAKIAKHD